MTMSCLADLYQGQQYAVALGYLQSATGAAIILAPQLASMLMGREGRFPRRCYIFAALLAVLHLALAWRGLEVRIETLQVSQLPRWWPNSVESGGRTTKIGSPQ